MSWATGPFSVNPMVGTNAPTFLGDPNARFSSIDASGGIVSSRGSGEVPAFVHVSASAVLASGVIVDNSGTPIAGATLRPYERLEYRWDFGDPSGAEIFVNPVTGALQSGNSDQVGPEAVYVYRAANTYTITLRVRGKSSAGGYVAVTATMSFAASLFGGTQYYFDSRAADDSGDGSSANPWKNLHGTHANGPPSPIDASGNVTLGHIQINIANGSSYIFPGTSLQGLQAVSRIRVAGWSNPSSPSAAKPVLQCTSNSSGNGVIFAGNSASYSDHVYSGLSIQAAATVTVGTTPVTFLSPKGERRAMTLNASIAGNTLTSAPTAIYTGYNNAIANSKIFSVAGNVAQDTTIVGGGPLTWTTSGAAQNVAADDMVVIPVATCAAFAGVIAGNVLTCSAPPGYASLAGCGTPTSGQLLCDLTGSVGLNRRVTGALGGNQFSVSAGPDVASELMFCGPQGAAVSDIYLDNCDVINNSTPANGVAVTNVADNGAGKIRVSVASTAIFVVNGQYNFSGIGGATKANGPYQQVQAIGAGFVDINVSSAGLGAYTGGGTACAGGAGVQWVVVSGSIFDPKSFATNMSIYGGTVSCLTGNAGAALDLCAGLFHSWFGVKVSVLGPGTGGQGGGAQVHQINPETLSTHGLVRWFSTDAGGATNSQMNFAFEPRNYNGYNGTKLGDYGGGFIHIADSLFTYATNGLFGGNQGNFNPSTTIGFYDGLVIERCGIGWITNSAARLTGVKGVTIRDTNFWQVGGVLLVPTGTAQGLGAYMPACLYRLKVYRASAQGQYGALPGNDDPVVKLNDGTPYVLPQELTDNVVWDDRTDAAVWNVVVSDQVAAQSVYNRNQYYAPSITGAPLGAFMLNGAAPETLATWRTHGSGGGAFDPDSYYLNGGPGWVDPANGKF